MRIEFEFEELPLRRLIDGREGLLADGIAEIDFGHDGRWVVAGIKLLFYRSSQDGKAARQYVTIPKADHDAQRIELVLLTEPAWRGLIQEKVAHALRAVDMEDREFKRAYGRAVQV